MKIMDGFVILFYKKAINSKEVNMKKFVAFILACILGFITFFIVVGSLNFLLLFNNLKMGPILILALFSFFIWITKRLYFFFYRKIDREHAEEEQK